LCFQNAGTQSDMIDGTDKHTAMDGDHRKRAAGKKGKKDDLENLKKEVEMVGCNNNIIYIQLNVSLKYFN